MWVFCEARDACKAIFLVLSEVFFVLSEHFVLTKSFLNENEEDFVIIHKSFNFYFLLHNRRKNWILENFRLPVFDGFTITDGYYYFLGHLEQDFTILKKCLSACNTNFVASLAQKLMLGIV